MVIAHLGIAVSLAGMASDAAFTKETLVAARVGEPHRVGPFSVTLAGIRPVVGDNWSALEAKLVARRGEGAPIVLRPQSRFSSEPPTVASDCAVAPRPAGTFSTILGQ